ncbi:MAG: hypothetical protein DLM54_01805, partial [Acidimicrobiales bacterium]
AVASPAVASPAVATRLRAAQGWGRGSRRNALGLVGLASLVVAGALAAGWGPGGHLRASTAGQPAVSTSGQPAASPSGQPAASSAGSPAGEADQRTAQQIAMARGLVASGQYARSLQLLDQVLQRQANQPQALAYRGWVLRLTGVAAHRAGLMQQGKASVALAVADDPTYPDARVFLGYILFQDDHDPADAVVQFRQFLADAPLPQMVDQTHAVVAQAFAAVGQPVPPASTAP